MARARARRFVGAAPARRRRVWVRQNSTIIGITTGAPAITDLLASYRAATGGPTAVGCTVGAVVLNLQLIRTAGAISLPGLMFGVIVGSFTDEAVDLDPNDFTAAAGAHQDWMWWGRMPLEPFSDAKSYRIKSQRKMQEVGQTLYIAFGADTADTYTVRVTSSVLLLLP